MTAHTWKRDGRRTYVAWVQTPEETRVARIHKGTENRSNVYRIVARRWGPDKGPQCMHTKSRTVYGRANALAIAGRWLDGGALFSDDEPQDAAIESRQARQGEHDGEKE